MSCFWKELSIIRTPHIFPAWMFYYGRSCPKKLTIKQELSHHKDSTTTYIWRTMNNHNCDQWWQAKKLGNTKMVLWVASDPIITTDIWLHDHHAHTKLNLCADTRTVMTSMTATIKTKPNCRQHYNIQTFTAKAVVDPSSTNASIV